MGDAQLQESRGPSAGPSNRAGLHDLLVRQQEAILAFGRRSNAQPALSVLMQDAAALVGEMLQADFSGVAIVERGEKMFLSVSRVAGPSQPPSQPVTSECGMDATASMAGYALSTASPVTTANLPGERRFCDLFLRGLGAISALCVPLYLAKRGLGALGVFCTSTREFTVDDSRFVETISHLLASSVGRLQMEEELRQQSLLASTVLEAIDRIVVTLDMKGAVVDVNPAGEGLLGRSSQQLRGCLFWDVFATPEEASAVRQLLQGARGVASGCQFQSVVLAENAERRSIAWSLRTTAETADEKGQWLLIGADRTEQVQPQGNAGPGTTAVSRPEGTAKEELTANAPVSPSSSSPTAAEIADTVGNITTDEHPFAPVAGKAGRELRRSPRRTFQYRQWIAPVKAHRLPRPSDFFDVQCNDISAGGISFVLDHPPDFEELIVALGQPSKRTYFVARVVRIQIRQEVCGPAYLVGCQFTGRVTL